MNIVKFDQNNVGRDFVVGDIHGCYDLLMSELNGVGFDKAVDRLFSVGDLIDRGPDSLKCLSLPFENWFHAVRGNHEELMFAALSGHQTALDIWMRNGGSWVLDADSEAVAMAAGALINSMPYAIEVTVGDKRVGIVHAEVMANDWGTFERDGFNPEVATWARSRIKFGDTTAIRGIDLVISGHTITHRPKQLGNQLYIDTGAFKTQQLTILELSGVTA